MKIKTGNPLTCLVIIKDQDTGEPIEIDSTFNISCDIVNSLMKKIATCDIEILDQVATKGGFTINVPFSVTSTWRAGIAHSDIKVDINGTPRNSENFSFEIVRSITK